MKKTVVLLFCTTIFVVSCSQSENGFTVNRKGTITAYKGQETSLVIPARIGNIPVTAIGNEVFQAKGLNKVAIPDGVVSIGRYAFFNNRIQSIIIPESVTSIGWASFGIPQNIRLQLTTITIGSNVKLTKYFFPSFDSEFVEFYNTNSKKAGTYLYNDNSWLLITDIYYYQLGVDEFNNGSFRNAIKYMNNLKNEFPSSTLVSNADKIINDSNAELAKNKEIELSRQAAEIRKEYKEKGWSEEKIERMVEIMKLFYESMEVFN